MKILAYYTQADVQVITGHCYFLGFNGENKNFNAYDVEASGNVAAGNKVGYKHENEQGHMLQKPGVECSNGIYVTVDSGNCIVYYSLG